MPKHLAIILVAVICSSAPAQFDQPLDHVTIAVRDLGNAQTFFRDSLGFTIKPGRLHNNGIINAHIKFPDGTALELLSVDTTSNRVKPDYLSGFYRGILDNNQAWVVVFTALKVKGKSWINNFKVRLEKMGYASEVADLGYARLLSMPYANRGGFVFWIAYSSPVADDASYLNHRNRATGIKHVCLADDPSTEVGKAPLWLYDKRGRTRIFGVVISVPDLSVFAPEKLKAAKVGDVSCYELNYSELSRFSLFIIPDSGD